MSNMPTPAPGQIWQENDPRKQRYVRILAVGRDGPTLVQIVTVDKETRERVKGSRVSNADLFRFGSYARGKYSFVEAAARNF